MYTFFLGMNVLGMAGAHTSYTCFEKTTNERIKSRYKTKDNQMIHPFSQKNMLFNYLYVLFGPLSPSFINYRKKMPENFYARMEVVTKELRMKRDKTNQNFIPIPSVYYFKETLKKFQNNCEKFREEFEFLNSKYLHKNNNEVSISVNDLEVNESNPETKINQELLKDDRVKFIYEVNTSYISVNS